MINFATVENNVRDLKAQFQAGQFDAASFEARLLSLIEMAPDGHYWAFGYDSEQWFRYDGSQWWPDTPNLNATAISTSIGPAASNQSADWQAINLGWFITSVVILVAIGSLVYTSV